MDIAGGVPLQHAALEIAKPAVTICTRLVTRDAALRHERLRRNVLLRVLRERAFGRNQREGCVAGAAGQNDIGRIDVSFNMAWRGAYLRLSALRNCGAVMSLT
jgi:hypothetical protein